MSSLAANPVTVDTLRAQQPARFIPLILIVLGTLLRLALAAGTYLNPDEAYHFFLADRSSLFLAYKASLTSAHPPLFMVVLYYVRRIGGSELTLRLPSVLAGGLFAWFLYKWLDMVAGRRAALVGLALAALSPTLVLLAAEVRQYSLLLFLMAASLYLFERAIRDRSANMVAIFAISEGLTILTHYSGLFFAAAMGIYALARLWADANLRGRLLATWIIGQIGLLGIASFLYVTHIRTMSRGGAPQAITATYLGREIFDPARLNVVSFAGRETFRLFHYVAGQPAVGGCLLLLYLISLVLTWPAKKLEQEPQHPQLVLLLFLPLLLVLGAALGRAYPYGGVRQCVFLSAFLIAGASIALAHLPVKGAVTALIVGLLIACSYVFPRPLGPYIRPKNQRRSSMTSAIRYIHHTAPAGSVFVLDNQSNFAFRYYFCPDQVIDFNLPAHSFIDFSCGSYRVSAPMADAWMYTPAQLGPAIQHAASRYGLPPHAELWFFQSGWAVDVEPVLRKIMTESGCESPRQFGANIVICELRAGAPAH